MQPLIYYTGTDTEGVTQDWIITPNDTANTLVMVQVTVINPSTQDVHVEVNQASAELVATDGSVFRPINTVERALYPAAGLDQEFTVPDFIPMWGPAILSANHQLQGYLVFEAPPETEFTEFRWLGPDEVIVHFH